MRKRRVGEKMKDDEESIMECIGFVKNVWPSKNAFKSPTRHENTKMHPGVTFKQAFSANKSQVIIQTRRVFMLPHTCTQK